MVRFRQPSGLRVLSRQSSLSAGGSVDERAGDLGLLLKTTNRSAFRKAASPVAIALRKTVLTRSKLGGWSSSRFFKPRKLYVVNGRLELVGKVHEHLFLHLTDHGRGERPYVIQGHR